MTAALLAASASTIDAITDVVGIAAVLVAVTLVLVLETRRASGRSTSRLLGGGAVLATVLALVIIGGRFQWIPDAGDNETAAQTDGGDSTAPDTETTDVSDDTVDVTTTVDSDSSADSSTTVSTTTTTPIVGPPTPPSSTVPEAPPSTVVPDDPATPGSVDGTPPNDRGPPAGATTYEVVEGDNFWTIAADTLEAERGGPVSDAEIAPYWQQLIDANADGLVEPGNPDLILPGQMLDVPPVGLPAR